jgi:ligand-binding sensor domain-containing protein
MIAIDTGNIKYFNIPGGFSGDQTVSFDNDSTWQSKLSQCGSILFAYGRASCFDKNNVLWERTSGNRVYSLTNGTNGYWTFYNSSATGLSAMDGIYDLTVDHHNNKLFGGIYGLIKYNDTAFTLKDTANFGLPFEPVVKVKVDKNNNLWIVGGTNEIAKYDGTTWVVSSVPFSTTQAYNMCVDSTGNVWLVRGTFGGGIYKFDGSVWTNYTTSNSLIPNNSIFGITIDKNNVFWMSYPGGLTKFDGTNWTNFDASTGYPGTGNGFLNVDRRNNIWNTNGNGVIVFNETGIIGIDEIDRQMGALGVYPNPATSQLTIEFTLAETKTASIAIKNILGETVRIIATAALIKGNNKIEMDVSELTSGIYFVQVKNKSKVYSTKFIKQ